MKAGVCRVMVIEDHETFRGGLLDAIRRLPDLECVGEAATCAETLERFAECDPDVVIVDLSLPDGHGVPLIARLKTIAPACKCVVLSAHDPETFGVWAMRAGGDAYLDKATPTAVICETVLDVWRNGASFAGDHARRALLADGSRRGTDALSDREFEVFLLIGQGRNTKEIAAALALSQKTIDNHKKAIREKLGLADHDKLLRFAALMCRPGPDNGAAVAADRALVAAFESRRLPVAEWTHRAHVRVAFHYLSARAFPVALALIRDGIRRLNATHGKPDAYHETITRAYATVIRARVDADRVHRDSASFLAAWPDLVGEDPLGPLWAHYSRERLLSPEARAGWLPPDLAPLPVVDG